jgi:hypothetical protein
MHEEPGTKDAAPSKKRRYSAPAVEKVALRPEEAVLGFCKNSAHAGPRGGNCRAVGICSTQGS